MGNIQIPKEVMTSVFLYDFPNNTGLEYHLVYFTRKAILRYKLGKMCINNNSISENLFFRFRVVLFPLLESCRDCH